MDYYVKTPMYTYQLVSKCEVEAKREVSETYSDLSGIELYSSSEDFPGARALPSEVTVVALP